MAKNPAFLFYSQDFFTGVSTMTFEDRGKFITLLALMHQKGRMKEETIRFLVGSISDNLKSKFRIDKNGFWYNERLETEIELRNKFTESRRENGSKGGRPKANAKPKQNLKDNLMEDANENENEIENEDEDKNGEIFENFRLAYPGVKRGFATEFKDFKKHKDWREVLPQLEQALKQQYYAREENRKNGTFVPEWKHLKTYISQRGWEEEINIKPQTHKSNGQKQTGSGFDLQRAFAKIDEMFDRREARSGGGGDN
jgi:hypothetical protein